MLSRDEVRARKGAKTKLRKHFTMLMAINELQQKTHRIKNDRREN